jgi:hypothetical protein
VTTDSSPSQTPSTPAPDANAPATPVAAAPAPAATAPVKVELAAPAAAPVAPTQATPAQAAPVAADAPTLPDTYTFKAAPGQTVDPALVSALSPAFKAAGLTQEKVDGIVSGFQQFQTQLVPQLMAKDLEATMKDPELGQLNWGKTQGYVNEALAAFTTPQFRQQLGQWGVANNLEFVRVFAAIGKAMRGDSPERGSPSTASDETMADRMYRKAAKPNIQ